MCSLKSEEDKQTKQVQKYQHCISVPLELHFCDVLTLHTFQFVVSIQHPAADLAIVWLINSESCRIRINVDIVNSLNKPWYIGTSEAASPVRLVRPRPDHFSAGCWSEDETIGPGVPRKLVFALHVRVSRNRSRSFISPPCASRNASGTSLRLPCVLHFRASPPPPPPPPQPCTCTSDLLFAMACHEVTCPPKYGVPQGQVTSK